jgi:hypothetical protein
MTPKWFTEALVIAYRGLLWAIVLATVAFIVRGAGLKTLPLILLPLSSAWILGEQRGHEKGVRDLREILGMTEEGDEK